MCILPWELLRQTRASRAMAIVAFMATAVEGCWKRVWRGPKRVQRSGNGSAAASRAKMFSVEDA